jgi:hypothetical protein
MPATKRFAGMARSYKLQLRDLKCPRDAAQLNLRK